MKSENQSFQIYPNQMNNPIVPGGEVLPVQGMPNQSVQSVQNWTYNAEMPVANAFSQQKRSSRHVIYAIEILVFTIVGWGWLGIREFMSATPVMDVTVFICLLISSISNLILSLIYYTTDQFKTSAQGFFAHILSIWSFYVYSLVESTLTGWNPLCCNSTPTFSVTKTYASAYYGGLPFHQTAGAVTLAFLSVFLILAAGQVRVCLEDPREWLQRKVTTSIACLISVHLGLFARNSRACDAVDLGGGVIGIAVAAWLFMADILPVAFSLMCGIDPNVKALIQIVTELTLTTLLTAFSGVLSSRIGGEASSVLMASLGVVVLWQVGAIVLKILELARLRRTPPEDYTPTAPSEHLVNVGAHFRPVMVLPGVRDMRQYNMHRQGGKKGW
jgi:hypothetical protein